MNATEAMNYGRGVCPRERETRIRDRPCAVLPRSPCRTPAFRLPPTLAGLAAVCHLSLVRRQSSSLLTPTAEEQQRRDERDKLAPTEAEKFDRAGRAVPALLRRRRRGRESQPACLLREERRGGGERRAGSSSVCVGEFCAINQPIHFH